MSNPAPAKERLKMKTKAEIPQDVLRRALKRCHERQFNGEDWQGVAIDAWNELGSPEDNDETFNYLTSSPRPGCDCGFCATAPWE